MKVTNLSKFLLFALIFTLIPFFAHPVSAESKPSAKVNIASSFSPDKVLVKYKAEAAKSSLNSNPNEKKPVVIRVPKGHDAKGFIQELNSQSEVEYAEKDYILRKSYIPSDPAYRQQWHHKSILTDQAWDITKGREEIIVAVIDDGVNVNHVELQKNIVDPYDVLSRASQFSVPSDHGTHIAGIIVGEMDNPNGGTGIAPMVRVMPINVFNGEEAYTSDIITAIEYAISHGADIINLSLGMYEYSLALNEAIQNAYQAGLIIVAAAGNEKTGLPSYPAAYENVVSVSSIDESNIPSSFSNYGQTIDIAAPGSFIYSSLWTGYGYMSGTSMAAPMVAGVAALVWSKYPDLNNQQIINQLFKTAVDLGPAGKDIHYGYGKLNAYKALTERNISKPSLTPFKDTDTMLTGSVSSDIEGAVVTVQDSKGIKATSPVREDFHFSIPLSIQVGGNRLFVKVTDKYGNISETVTVIVIDTIPPVRPEVDAVTNTSTIISGKSEPGALVAAYNTGSMLSQAITNEAGIFEIHINPQQIGTQLEIVSTDVAGNKSDPTTLFVIKNTTSIQPGWVYSNSNWLYLDPDTGSYKTGWLNWKGYWYFLDQKGIMVTGWLVSRDKTYYVSPDGAMQTGWFAINGKWYFFDQSGYMRNGWIRSEGKWYYLAPNGITQTGWLHQENKWYYLLPNGSMAVGWKEIKKKWYFFYNSGEMAYNTKIGIYRIGADGSWIH
jgi:cell wall-associated protease